MRATNPGKKAPFLIFLTLTSLWFFKTQVMALTITLSDLSSGQTNPALLDAMLDFEVTDSTLTLTITNQTHDYNINQIYFTATSKVRGLNLYSVTEFINSSPVVPVDRNIGRKGWRLQEDKKADGFGVFDFALKAKGGEKDPDLIDPLNTMKFLFDITGTGVSETDFATEPASPAVAVAKFVNGPNDDSAFGAATPVPEPATMFLLGSGLMGMAAIGRKKYFRK